MDKKELRKKRQAILREIDRLEVKRCTKCMGNTTTSEQMHCGCHAAKKIRMLGEEYNGLNTRSRKKRINDEILDEFKANGLTPEIYRKLREAGATVNDVSKLTGWHLRKLRAWRSKNISQTNREIVVKSEVKSSTVDRNILTPEAYRNSKKIGYTDKEIRQKYEMTQTAFYSFKAKHDFMMPKGKHSKYTRGKQISGGIK